MAPPGTSERSAGSCWFDDTPPPALSRRLKGRAGRAFREATACVRVAIAMAVGITRLQPEASSAEAREDPFTFARHTGGSVARKTRSALNRASTGSPGTVGRQLVVRFGAIANWGSGRRRPPHLGRPRVESGPLVPRGIHEGPPRDPRSISTGAGCALARDAVRPVVARTRQLGAGRCELTDRRPAQRPPSLRSRQRVLPALARPGARLHLRVLRRSRHAARRRTAREARPRLPQAPAAPRRNRGRGGLRLGRARASHGPQVRGQGQSVQCVT